MAALAEAKETGAGAPPDAAGAPFAIATPARTVPLASGLAPGARALSPLGTAGSRTFAAAVALGALAFTAALARVGVELPARLAAGGGAVLGLFADPGLSALLLVAAGAAVLALPLALGMPVTVLLLLAGFDIASVAALALSGAKLWLAIGLAPLLALLGFLALVAFALPGARTLGNAVLLAAAGSLAVTGGPTAVALGLSVVFDVSLREPARALLALTLPGIAAGAPLLLAWVFAEIGATTRLDAARSGIAWRDAVFRTLAPLAGAIAAYWLAARAQALAAVFAARTPLASLAPSVGVLAALALMGPVLWVGWRLPGMLDRARHAGRIDGRVAAETLLLPGAALATGWIAAGLGAQPGAAMLGALWLPAVAVYAWARARTARPLAAPGRPLWLVLPGEPGEAVRRLAAHLAQRWRAGPVTLLALPSQLAPCAGDHAHAAERAGVLDLLLPTHPAQVTDWAGALPTPWTVMPLRELYAPASLWPHVLGERLEPDALVLRLLDRDAPLPGSAAIEERLRALLAAFDPPPGAAAPEMQPGAERPPTSGLRARLRAALAASVPRVARALRRREAVAWPVARSDAPRIDPAQAGADATLLSPGGADAATGDALDAWLDEQQRRVGWAEVRHVFVEAPPGEPELAQRLAERLDGRVDAAGRVVEAVALALPRQEAGVAFAMAAMPLRSWRLIGRLMGRLIAFGAAGGGAPSLVLWVAQGLVRAFAVGQGEFELLVVEATDTEPQSTAPPLIRQGLASGALRRAVLLRPPARASLPLPEGFSAALPCPPLPDPALQAERLAAQVLAMSPAPATPSAAEPTTQAAVREPAPRTAEPPVESAWVRPSAWAIRSAILVCDPRLDADLRADLMQAVVEAHARADRLAPGADEWASWYREFAAVLDADAAPGIAEPAGTDEDLPAVQWAKELGPRLERMVQDLPLRQESGSRDALWPHAVKHAGAVATLDPGSLLSPQSDPPFGRLLLLAADLDADGEARLALCAFFQLAREAPAKKQGPAAVAPRLRRRVCAAAIDRRRLVAARERLSAPSLVEAGGGVAELPAPLVAGAALPPVP